MSEESLITITHGMGRGVVVPVGISNDTNHDFTSGPGICLGKTKLFTVYKAGRVNKLVIAVPPQGTSQECSKCSHTHPDNRQTQAVLVCRNCGFTENADFNATLVIKKKGIRMLVGELSVKQKKRAMRLKKKQHLGQELPEGTRGETEISRTESHAFRTHPSANRETTTTTVLTV